MQCLYISGSIILLNICLLGAACLWEVSQVRSVHVAKQNIEFTSSYPLQILSYHEYKFLKCY